MPLSSEDLLVILALCREQTLDRAAAWLGRDSSSVFRAIKRIETRLGTPLFSRSKSGFEPLGLTRELAEKGREISETLRHADNIASQLDLARFEKLRVTTTDVILSCYILPNIDQFRAKYPGTHIEFNTSNQFAKMWERGFDVAVRPSSNPPGDLIGHFLRPLDYKLVHGSNYQPKVKLSGRAIQGGDWLIPGGTLTNHPVRKWFSQQVSNPDTVTQFDSMNLLVQAAKSGLGLAALPGLARITDGLVTLSDVEVPEVSELWCLYHSSNRENPLVQAFVRFAKHCLDG
ncbi:LysR family transcriptional regulator (plasmid) [Rhodobacteraceae bacterium M382]|nr:LysR family transcriptional regulator [Rhodobacteraceae bacterium M382]